MQGIISWVKVLTGSATWGLRVQCIIQHQQKIFTLCLTENTSKDSQSRGVKDTQNTVILDNTLDITTMKEPSTLVIDPSTLASNLSIPVIETFIPVTKMFILVTNQSILFPIRSSMIQHQVAPLSQSSEQELSSTVKAKTTYYTKSTIKLTTQLYGNLWLLFFYCIINLHKRPTTSAKSYRCNSCSPDAFLAIKNLSSQRFNSRSSRMSNHYRFLEFWSSKS